MDPVAGHHGNQWENGMNIWHLFKDTRVIFVVKRIMNSNNEPWIVVPSSPAFFPNWFYQSPWGFPCVFFRIKKDQKDIKISQEKMAD